MSTAEPDQKSVHDVFNMFFGGPDDEPGAELGLDRVLQVRVNNLMPSPENDTLYRRVDAGDPEIRQLANSIKKFGLLEPIRCTRDDYIISGHRRWTAARVAGLEKVPCIQEPFNRADDPDRFVRLLREHNRQRIKSFDEKLREEIVSSDPDEAHRVLTEYREAQSRVDGATLEMGGRKTRCDISPAKAPFLAAIKAVLSDRRAFWPLSDRSIHYALLNDPPLRHASKPKSRYGNTVQSYKALVELLTRGRLTGDIPMHAIADDTRPIDPWDVYPDVAPFIAKELDGFLKDYYRNLMASQPNHVELVGEKNTVRSILREVAAEYCIPLTTGRGYCSLPPRYKMAQRFKKSGKSKLVLLLVSDFDPDGEEIAASFARSMRDDFGIDSIHPIKVALTADQVQEFDLPPQISAKESSVHYTKFTDRHGTDVFELEALDPVDLQDVVREAINGVIDVDLFNREVDQEKSDAAKLSGIRETVQQMLLEMKIGNTEIVEGDDG